MSGWRGQTRKTVCSTAYVSQPCSTTLGRCLAPSPSRTTTARAARTVCGPTFVNDIEKCYLEWSPVLSPTPTLPNRLFQLPLSSLAPSPASTPAGRPSARSSSPSFGTAPRGPCGRMSVCPIGAPYTSDTIASSTSSVVSRHGLSLPLHAQRAACAGPSTGSTISRRSAVVGADEFASDTAKSADQLDEGGSNRPIWYRSPNRNDAGVQRHGEPIRQHAVQATKREECLGGCIDI